jgi:aminoglycoside 3'-phosphotransferase I
MPSDIAAADRYQDLAILWNGISDFDGALQARLFVSCGVTTPDERRLRFYVALDEFF